MLPSRLTYGVLLAGLVLSVLIAIVLPNPDRVGIAIWTMLIYDAIVLGLMLFDSFRTKANRVTVKRQELQRLSIGRENPVHLTIETGDQTAYRKQETQVQIYDLYPVELGVSMMPLQTAQRANGVQELTYSVRPTQRGEYLWKGIQVRQLSPWRLVWHDWTVPQAQKVSVYPDLMGLRSLTIRLTMQSSGAMKRSRRMGIGTEFAELREYGVGDDLRMIDWKATARRGVPLVRVLEPEQEQTLIILLDRGRLMTAQVKDLSRFDWGMNAALSLALTGLHRGDRVGIGVFDRQMHTWIAPERGQQQLNRFIEKLTPIEPELLEPDYLGAVTTVVNQQTRRALVVVITDIVDLTASAELLAAMGRLAPRYLPFCVALRDPQMDQRSQTLTGDVPSTYERAVALDLLAQRQVAFSKLKQKGVLVLDAPAHQVTDALVDRYLQLKAKNQL